MSTITGTKSTTGSATGFLSTLGVNVKASYKTAGYDNSSLIVRSLDYLGVNSVRDHFADTGRSGAVIDALAAAGIKFNFGIGSWQAASGQAELNSFVSGIAALRSKYADSIIAIEGLNEVNLKAFSYNGATSVTAAAAYQKLLYQTVKGNAVLSDVMVGNLSIGNESEAAYAELGDMTRWSDYANSHAYVLTPSSTDFQMERSMSRAQAASTGDQVFVTETGYSTLASAEMLGVSELAQAKLTIASLLTAYENGSSKTFLYELFDNLSTNHSDTRENHFGLFGSDGRPKLAATAVHNLTTILSYSDPAATAPAGTARVTVAPSDGHVMTLAKAGGSYDTIVWRDVRAWDNTTKKDLNVAAATMRVDLGGTQDVVYVYDPLSGTQPVAVYRNVSAIDLAVGDRPLIVEVGSRSAVVEKTTNFAPDLSMTADAFVASLDRIGLSSGVRSVTLTGSRVLDVSSIETMRDMISNYGSTLAKVVGGYSFRIVEKASAQQAQERAYDSAGTLVSTTDDLFSNGKLAWQRVTAASGTVTEYRYEAGALKQSIETTAAGAVTTTSYDPATGFRQWSIVKGTDGYKTSRTFTADRLATITVADPVGTTTVDTLNAAGTVTSSIVTSAAGKRTTRLYDANGALTQFIVKNADGTGRNIAYGITGKSYTSQLQETNAAGKVVLVERYHADGTLDYREVNAADGSRSFAYYDASGRQLSDFQNAANGSRANMVFAASGSRTVTWTTAAGQSTVRTFAAGATVDNYVQAKPQTYKSIDLVFRHVHGALSTWKSVGNGTAGFVKGQYVTAVDPNWKIEATLDWNGDGQSDILWRHTNGTISIWNGNGAGFRQGTFVAPVGNSWKIVATGDFNGDGKDDIAWRNSDGAVSLWNSNGTSFGAGFYRAPTGDDWAIVSSGDLNGDGRADLLWRNEREGTMTTWTSNGTGFKQAAYYASGVDASWKVAATGDVNGDGMADIIWRNTNGAVSVWNSRADGGFDQAKMNAMADTRWQLVQAGDVDGDGRADLVWQHDGGAMSIWNSTGTEWRNGGYFDATLTGTGWQITGGPAPLVATDPASNPIAPNAFDIAAYAAANPDLALRFKGDMAALNEQYYSEGMAQGRTTSSDGSRSLIFDGGDHKLVGTSNADTIFASGFDDVMTGGRGADTFVLGNDAAKHVVTDFSTGDMLSFNAFAKAGYSPAIAMSGSDTVISFGNGGTVTLTGVSSDRLVRTGNSYTFG